MEWVLFLIGLIALLNIYVVCVAAIIFMLALLIFTIEDVIDCEKNNSDKGEC